MLCCVRNACVLFKTFTLYALLVKLVINIGRCYSYGHVRIAHVLQTIARSLQQKPSSENRKRDPFALKGAELRNKLTFPLTSCVA